MSTTKDEKGGSQVVPDKPGEHAHTGDGAHPEPGSDHEQDRERTSSGSADKDHPDSF